MHRNGSHSHVRAIPLVVLKASQSQGGGVHNVGQTNMWPQVEHMRCEAAMQHQHFLSRCVLHT